MPKKPTKNPTEESGKRGRPPKYKPEFCQQMIQFFSIDPTVEQERLTVNKKGDEVVITDRVANKLPTFHNFAAAIEVNEDTIVEWASKKNEKGELVYPDFSAAYKKAKQLQKYFLIENGMNGVYNPAFTIFVAKNITDMRDHFDIEKTVKDRRVIIDEEF